MAESGSFGRNCWPRLGGNIIEIGGFLCTANFSAGAEVVPNDSFGVSAEKQIFSLGRLLDLRQTLVARNARLGVDPQGHAHDETPCGDSREHIVVLEDKLLQCVPGQSLLHHCYIGRAHGQSQSWHSLESRHTLESFS